MVSEFEKALMAINGMSYDEKMKFAKKLRKNHENMAEHFAYHCVFCQVQHEKHDVCELCFERFADPTSRDGGGIVSCEKEGCVNNSFMCYECDWFHKNEKGEDCLNFYCRQCLSRMPEEVYCEDCEQTYYNKFAGTMSYIHPKFTYDEIMQLGKALKKGHKNNKSHIVNECIWCCGYKSNQLACSYCYEPLDARLIDYRDYTDEVFNCDECLNLTSCCLKCRALFHCKKCRLDSTERYCSACLVDMPLEIYCEKHDISFSNPFGTITTKPCRL